MAESTLKDGDSRLGMGPRMYSSKWVHPIPTKLCLLILSGNQRDHEPWRPHIDRGTSIRVIFRWQCCSHQATDHSHQWCSSYFDVSPL